MKFKVIIIGAGPAGIASALNLYNLDIKNILVIERKKFPRYKCCAGYITTKTKNEYERLGLDTTNIHYSLIKDFGIYYKYNLRQTIENKFLFTNEKIDRVELDNAFFELAKSKKIKIWEETYIKKHIKEENSLILSNGKEVFYDYLIFADGYNSYGNKYQDEIKNKNIAMQYIFESKIKSSIEIHFGVSSHGYGWVSSYNGITNVGLTDLYDSKKDYEKIFNSFLKKLKIDKTKVKLTGTFTPIGIRNPIINNMYFVGDAAGTCDPLTLSGVNYALLCGKYCAKSIKENDNKYYLKYINSIKRKFDFMKFIAKLFYLKFNLFLIFDVGCKIFSKFISFAFNNFFVKKK
jgi:flavin-dependent dehydrogenase